MPGAFSRSTALPHRLCCPACGRFQLEYSSLDQVVMVIPCSARSCKNTITVRDGKVWVEPNEKRRHKRGLDKPREIRTM
jgi:hypothetical protein